MFADEADVDLNPGIAPQWQGRGRQEKVPAAGQNRRRSIFGGVDVRTHEVTTCVRQRKCAADFLAFLDILAARYHAGRVWVVLDNFSIHKTKAVHAWLVAHPRFTLVFLPTYSPNLNHIEPFWRWLKRRVACNRLRGAPQQILQHEAARQAALEELLTAVEWAIVEHNAAVRGIGPKDRAFQFAA